MRFDSRSDAARRLAAALKAYGGRHPLVLAIPRGAVEIGAILAESLGGDLDVIESGADGKYLEREIREQSEVLRRRRALYTPSRPPIDPGGRIVIVVDDGIATGASMIAALHAAREKQPARLICAVPVAAAETLARIKHYADEVVCLNAPLGFHAVGQFYRDFRQVEDAEVVALLKGGSQ